MDAKRFLVGLPPVACTLDKTSTSRIYRGQEAL